MDPFIPPGGDGAIGVRQLLGEDGERLLWRAWRGAQQDDGRTGALQPVLVAASASEHPSPGFLDRLSHEARLGGHLGSDWAARPIELVREHGRTVLVLDDPGGRPLEGLLGGLMDVARFLHLAIGIAAALGETHRHGIIHKDIKPANILVDCDDGRVRLMGFGLASRLPRERQEPGPSVPLGGTLAYMAPEQTGRMNRSIDSRSDLYSFGIVLYRMLTGTLPFEASEPIEWMHCHVARVPQPPHERVPACPAVLSDMVMKLLAKSAEDRYQTAAGIGRDMKRALDEHERGSIGSFALGAFDAPDRLLIPEKIYGRAREVEALLASFDRVVSGGRPELVLVSGNAGIGKSATVHELHRVLVPARGFFAAGKFDQFDHGIPYATLAQAFRSLIRQLLSRSDAELEAWRGRLAEALGPNGQLMVSLIPELALVIGEQPPVADLPPQDARSRFKLVLRRFVSAFAQREHPLVLFVDDLQWLDAATLDLVTDLLVSTDVGHLLLIGAYRDTEVGPDHALNGAVAAVRASPTPVVQIRLGSLSPGQVEELLADALRTGRREVRSLADLVFGRTGGNPFFAIHFLTDLVEEGLLGFEPAAAVWRWDLPRIHAKGFTDNVADLMAARLDRLPRMSQVALEQMACVGNVTPTATLAMLQQATEAAVHVALWPAVRADLVVYQDGGYRFLHDRIREVAYDRVPEAERPIIHLRIARLLARSAGVPGDARIFEIVGQFARGADLLTSGDEREEVAALHLAAGRRAKAGGAHGAALRYVSAGRALLPADPWQHSYRLAFDLELDIAECAFLTGDFAAARDGLGALMGRARDHVDLGAATRLSLNLSLTMGDMDRANRIGLDFLRRADPEWPAEVTADAARREYERLAKRLDQATIERLLDLPPMTDRTQLALMDVLTALSSSALFAGEALRHCVICRMVAICLDHGNSDGAPVAYVLLGSIRGMFFHDYEGGLALAQAGLDLVERPGFGRLRARVYLGFGVHVSIWTQPLEVARVYFRLAFAAAQESGDVAFAAFSCIDLITNLIAVGTPLAEVEREAERNREIVRGLKFDTIRRGIAQQLTVVRMLRGKVATAVPFSEAVIEADGHEAFSGGVGKGQVAAERSEWHRSFLAIGGIRELQARAMFRDFDGGLAAVARDPPLWTVPTQFERVDYQFFAALCHAARCDAVDGEERQIHLDALALHHAQVMRWADSFPATFANRAALVGAERARVEGRILEAEQLYEQAVRLAHQEGFVQIEGLAYEHAAHFYAARGFEQIAHLYLGNARRCYVHWGADGKVRQLDRINPHLRDRQRDQAPASLIGASVENLDLATVMKVSQAVSGEIIQDRLLDTIMRTAIEQAGAEHGVLMLGGGAEQRIAVEARTQANAIDVRVRDAAVADAALPISVLNYVVHTRESVVIEDALAQNQFSDDPYVRDNLVRSILCLPLLNRGKLIGVLYLENNLASGVFAPPRIPVLKLLVSQAAISLENTRLYRDLARREAKIRRLVDANIIGIFIWDVEGRITEANDAFLRIVGRDRDDMRARGLGLSDLAPPDGSDPHERLPREHGSSGTLRPREMEFVRKDGARVPVLVGMTTFEADGSEGVAYVLDLTELKRAEREARENEQRYLDVQAQLAHANRVATMGQMTASIAHELNQPIAAVVLYAEAGKRWLGRPTPDLAEVEKTLDRVEREGKRAGDVIHRTRALFKKSAPSKASLAVNEVVAEVVAFTRGEAAKNRISVSTRLAPDLPAVYGDRVQVQQVLLNLIVNAIEAMSDGGDDPRDLDVATARDAEGDGVVVSVGDTGPGFGPDGIEHLFDAFYTTKPTGLGMGLSICRSIIEAHGGRLWAASNVPHGAVFRFTLPRGQDLPTDDGAAPAA